MKTTFTFFLISIFLNLPAQNIFQKTYGGGGNDASYSIQQTMDNGYILVGGTRSYSQGDNDVYLIKTNSFGDTIWTKTYGGADNDNGYCVQQTSDLGYIITGITTSFGAGGQDIYLIKTDQEGDTLWTKSFGGVLNDWGSAVQQTLDGGYIIIGSTESFGSGNFDYYLIKTDSFGNTIWTKTFGGSNWDYGSWIELTSDNGFIMTGHSNSYGEGNYDVYLIKTNDNGDTLWTKTYGGLDDEYSKTVKQTIDGGYVIVGQQGIYQTGNTFDVYLIRTDINGNESWAREYGGINYDAGASVDESSDGGFIITGETRSFGIGQQDVYLIKTDNTGDTLWTKRFGDINESRGFSVQETQDGGYVLCGSTYSSETENTDVYLIKTDVNGNTSPLGIPFYQHTNLEFVVYPNPTVSEITIEFKTNTTDIYTIEIYSAFGQQIKRVITSENKANIDISELDEGIYFVVITDIQNRQWSRKIIKNAPQQKI